MGKVNNSLTSRNILLHFGALFSFTMTTLKIIVKLVWMLQFDNSIE